MSKLILFRGRDKMGSYDLVPAGTIIGRGDDVDVHVENTMISRRPASVRKAGEGDDDWVVEDLGGANGTWVNGERVVPGSPQVLKIGDLIELGDHVLLFADENSKIEEMPTWAAIKSPAAKEESTAMVGGQSMDWMRKKTRAKLGTHVAFSAGGVQREVQLSNGNHMIGFTDACKIRLPGNPMLGKEAAQLKYSGRWSVEALSGLAGVRLNGEKLKGRRELHDGDVVSVKGIEVTFHTAVVD